MNIIKLFKSYTQKFLTKTYLTKKTNHFLLIIKNIKLTKQIKEIFRLFKLNTKKFKLLQRKKFKTKKKKFKQKKIKSVLNSELF